MEYAILALLAAAPVVLFCIVRWAFLRGAGADGAGPAPIPPQGLETKLAAPMAVLVIAFLTVLAAMLPTPSRDDLELMDVAWRHLPLLQFIWCVFFLEALVGIVVYWKSWNTRRKVFAVLGALVPPLRLIPGHSAAPQLRYVPFVGWHETSKQMLARIERAFSGPMMVAALFILPIVGVDYLWKEPITTNSPLDVSTDVGTQAIWLFFAIEFFVLVAAAPKKGAYCKSHWLDLVIVLLPLVYFLRCLRILRLGRLAKVQRMTRVYRLRGVMLRLLRTIIVLKLADRMGGWASRKRLAMLRNKLNVMKEEIDELNLEIERIEEFLGDSGQGEEKTEKTRVTDTGESSS